MAVQTIPASATVNIIPNVLAGGGNNLNFIELMLTTNTRVPIGAIPSFPSLLGVQSYFGALAAESNAAAIYFAGFDGSNVKPSALLFAQYPIVSVGAYVRGASLSAMTLAQLQALSGVLAVTIDGTLRTSATINLSSATSFTMAGQLITNGLGLTGPTVATVTGSVGATFTATGSGTALTVSAVTGVIIPGTLASAAITGTGVPALTYIVSQTSGTTGAAGVYVTSVATTAAAAAIVCSSTTATVTAITTGVVAVGQQVSGTGITAGTYVGGLGTGTGGTGTYILTQGMQAASTALTMATPVTTYDSVSSAFTIISSTTGAASTIGFVSGTLSASLLLTAAAGAVTSQGAIASVPGSFMASVIATTQNWVTFQTLFDPDAGSGNAQKQLFAAWVNSTSNQYIYIAEDTDITATQSTAATTSLGYLLNQTQSSGTVPVYVPVGQTLNHGAFIAGAIASIDFTQFNGRTNLKFRSQTGLALNSLNQTQAANLDANKYDYYAGNASRSQQFNFFSQGAISGPFLWIDAFVNQIWLNNLFQQQFLLALTQLKSIPYNANGSTLLRQYAQGPINSALNFGAIVPGVPLSPGQAAFVNNAAGFKIDGNITQNGYYLLIAPISANTRILRQSPSMQFFYTDGGSVNMINMTSTDVQ